MKKTLTFLLVLFCIQFSFSQLNIELVSHLPYNTGTNDVWGYTAPDGTEYALVGLHNGVSIVSLADPANLEEVVFVEGEFSTWRDLRTFGQYAYIVADQPGSEEGLWVLDLSNLPNDVTFNQIFYTFPNDTLGVDTLFSCHNVWVDEKGFAYLTGCDINSGGAIFLDLNVDPFNPEFVGLGKDIYSHDNYARNDTLYTSEIFAGQFGIYDVSNKAAPVLLGTQETPFRFTHNVWLSDDGKTLFTTDEKANAPTASFDVSDPTDIQLLDEFRPAATLGTDVIPHNVHVLNDFVVISHYTDGCIIVDANEPDNLVEVGNFDTNTDFTSGFHGAWGAYPFFPSGLIAITDIENGLFILNPTYVRASYLEGQVTDINSGIGISNTVVSIQASTPTLEHTGLTGDYKTGLATAGTFNVTFKATGYFDQTILTTISSGEITVLDVQMIPLPAHTITGTVVDEATGTGLEDAILFIENDDFSYETTTNAAGQFTLLNVIQGTYSVYIGKWGFQNLAIGNQPVKQDDDLYFELSLGYEDNFNTDLEWTVTGNATSGIWERGVPNGTNFQTTIYNPFFDSPFDLGNRCYVTGNGDVETLFDDQVDNGTTFLTSPVMLLASNYDRPALSYDAYFYTVGSNNLPNDTLYILMTNGTDTIELERFDRSNRVQDWISSPIFDLADLMEVTDEMKLIFEISDEPETPNVIEAGLDNFKVEENNASSVFSEKDDLLKMEVYPNPFREGITIKYAVEKDFAKLKLQVFNVFGQQLEAIPLTGKHGSVQLNPGYLAGIYVIVFNLDGERSRAVRVMKL